MSIKIRAAAPEDYAAWRALWNGYLEFYGSTLAEEITRATWHKALSPASGIQCRLAETDQQVVGFAMCVLHEGTWVSQPVCYLEDLFVSPAARGKGAGKALIEAIGEEAREQGWSKVYWVTRENNSARALYDKLATVDDFVRYTMNRQG
ncbi:GNAT family N-acetyltransferase [Tatumella citrea]|uniref:GNAT family acetyltransferase n=1 Tax=Tatumella citrea TaxID=53336 RepID=A0A1Y0L4W4_TATCI|nr:GNAT family N-acetyltransferase [Tatumella citrea]ARU92719.1 GNAT family acetyltransferase [Tatumella citrea]ARU96757.1 GNAT family acetyltransferase [Tatumella citrea]